MDDGTFVALLIGKSQFACLAGNCDYQYGPAVLEALLPRRKAEMVAEKQVEALAQAAEGAQADQYSTCPFCPYTALITNPQIVVFQCENKSCMKSSCR